MRIYEGSPRQDWEEVLRSVGRWLDRELLREVLLVEMAGGFLVQGLGPPTAGMWSESGGQLSKRTFELSDERVAELMDEVVSQRGGGKAKTPRTELTNYYQQSLRLIGRWVDGQRPRDLFLLEQEGAFVIRMLTAGATGIVTHKLAEFTRDEFLAMIEAAPQGLQ